jgi:glucokinase
LISHRETLTEAQRGPDAVLETLQRTITDVAAPFTRVAAIGVACAGQIRPGDGLVVQAPNLGWRELPLGKRLREAFGLPVVVENDVRAAAWGEYHLGAGGGAGSLLAVFVGTGLGSGCVLDGRLWRGAGNVAGEVGHTEVVPGGFPCRCGQRGCAEQYVSGSGFQRRFAAARAEGVKSSLARMCDDDPERLTARMLADAAEAGDELAGSLMRDAERYLTMAIANYVTIVNPQVLVFGGGVIESVPKLGAVASEGVLARTTLGARASLRIERARLGDWSGAIGAGTLAGASEGVARPC